MRLVMIQLPAINSPQFDWARTHLAHQPRPMGEVFEPEVAAKAIWRAAMRPGREYWLGRPTLFTILGELILPGWLDRYLAKKAVAGQERAKPVQPDRRDNLYETVHGLHGARGAFSAEAHQRATMLPGQATRAGVVALGALSFLSAGLVVGLSVRRH